MKFNKFLSALMVLLFSTSGLVAKENVGSSDTETNKKLNKKLKEGCDAASAEVNLDINNVRARVMNGGDMWWDLVGNPRYEIPKTTEPGQTRRHSLFAGALWIGGIDQGGNLREAAMTYRQDGSDFYPGPLDTSDASISANDCERWDQIWKITQDEIDRFKETGEITEAIRTWPAEGNVNKGESRYLAPFNDENGDGEYNPQAGDHPVISGDQALWFVYNDKGNIHSETRAPAIGLEVQTMAFAFATNDEINNMTFYDQKVINRSKNRLDSVYFGQWVDADLGFAFDDFVGCDTTRDLGICYNGDDFDETLRGYGNDPPAVGVDFFEGPKDRDGNIIGMENFVYYVNDFSTNGNPEEAQDYYNYLSGTWKNGSRFQRGGDAFEEGTEPVNYMFPSDPRNSDGWSEVTENNTPGDRRFLQSAGPFTLMPGAVNFVTSGVVWANSSGGGNTGSWDLLKVADDKAQQLYNNDFEIVDGPEVPEVEVQELNQEIVISLKNATETEDYTRVVINEDGDSIRYEFQGYRIFQVTSPDIQQFDDPEVARQVVQVDKEDKIDRLINRSFDPNTQTDDVPDLKVDGSNDGLRHTFQITNDAFASGESELVNFTTYYFKIIPYASADPDDSVSARADRQYLAGRQPIEIQAYPHPSEPEKGGSIVKSSYGDQPQLTRIEGKGNGGLVLELTEDSRKEIINNNFAPNPTYQVSASPADIFVYDPLNVPSGDFTIKMVDSGIVNSGTVNDNQPLGDSATWQFKDEQSGKAISSTEEIGKNYEQILSEYGFSVNIGQPLGASIDTVTENMGFLEASFDFEDQQKDWLTGIEDRESPSSFTDDGTPYPYNWIRSGNDGPTDDQGNPVIGNNDRNVHDAAVVNTKGQQVFVDPNQVYEDILGGIIAPYGLTARAAQSGSNYTMGPAIQGHNSYTWGNIDNLHSVDLVFTNDKSKWTQSVVIEMSSASDLAEGGANRHELREHGSWLDPNNIQDGEPVYADPGEDKGRSWFPGYAINLETGERLNIIFGEDSWLKEQNGNDMLWNPTSEVDNPAAGSRDYVNYQFGGKHYVYLMASSGLNVANTDKFYYEGRRYSGSESTQYYQDILKNGSTNDIRQMYSAAMWVMLPVLNEGSEYKSLEEGLIPTKTTISLRVSNSYKTFSTGNNPENNNQPMYEFSSEKVATKTSEEMGETALDMVNIVPNPYYAFSEYENNQLDERVRITNIPQQCNISIYTLNGKKVKEFNIDQPSGDHQTYIDWNLRNHKDIPIASGMYLIHVDGTVGKRNLGERTLKWYAVMRPTDLNTF